MRISFHNLGVTLVELMIVITITGVLAMLAAPSFLDAIDRNRLKAVTDTVNADLQFAKSEAIKRNQPIVVDFTTSNGGTTWCYGFKLITPSITTCNCNQTNASQADACVIDPGVLKVVKSTDFAGVSITPSADFSFDNVRGTVNPGGDVTLNSARSKQTKVIVKPIGRIHICSPSGTSNVAGYSTSCP